MVEYRSNGVGQPVTVRHIPDAERDATIARGQAILRRYPEPDFYADPPRPRRASLADIGAEQPSLNL